MPVGYEGKDTQRDQKVKAHDLRIEALEAEVARLEQRLKEEEGAHHHYRDLYFQAWEVCSSMSQQISAFLES